MVNGGPYGPLLRKRISRRNFLTGIYQDYSKTLLLTKKKNLEIIYGLENRGEILIFMLHHFDENDHVDFSFSLSWCTKKI